MTQAGDYHQPGDWEPIRNVIHENHRFLITTHVNADPDALGSELALSEGLKELNKETLIINPTSVSVNNAFLDPDGQIQEYDNNHDLSNASFDAVFILDISRWERLGPLAEPLRKCSKPKICIDHHPYSGGFADFHIVNVNACASAEIVYDLLHYLNVSLTSRMAEAIYAAMLADTGSFSFSNTNARSHRIVSELLQKPLPARTIYENLYQNFTPARLQFLGHCLSRLQFDCGDRIAWMSIPFESLHKRGMTPEDVEGFADLPRNCRSVLLSIVFLEVEPGDIKISLRSKGDFNSNRLASQFGGGGHCHASGIRLNGQLHEIEQLVLQSARAAIPESSS